MKREITALTGLRFLAAFMVFVFHVNMRTKMLFLPWPVYNIVSHGAFGVTVFFVLSGFLLAYSHQKDFPNGEAQDSKYYLSFMYKRIARIYPAYFIGMLLFAGVCLLFNNWPKISILLPNIFMIQAAIPTISMAWYGSGSWSVSIEIFFYLFFPLLLPILLRIQQARNLFLILIAITVVSTLGGLSFRIWPDYISYPLMYANPLFRCFEFIAGMIASLLVFRFRWQVKESQALLAVMVCGIYIAGFGPKLIGFVAHDWIVIPTIVILLAGIVEAKQTKVLRLLTHPWLVYAGRVSYCFYIAQLPLFCYQDFLLEHQVKLPWWTELLTFATTAIIAVLMHHLIEIPAHRWLLARGAKLPFLRLNKYSVQTAIVDK